MEEPVLLKPPPYLAGTERIRDLRRQRSLAPGGAEFGVLARAFLPLVYSLAGRLVPERPEGIEELALTVFRVFAYRWKRLPRRTAIASWLVRTTWLAAQRQRRQFRLPPPPKGSETAHYHWLFEALTHLRQPYLDVVCWRILMGIPGPVVAQAMKRRESRVARMEMAVLAKLAKLLRKKKATVELSTLLAGYIVPVPPDVEQRVLGHIRSWTPREQKERLVRATLRAWRWVEFKRALRSCVRFAGIALGTFAAIVATVFILFRQGYLMPWIMDMSNRQLVKEIPGLDQPARPWLGAVEMAAPKTAADLYSLTNIWPVQLNFTAAQWHDLQPTRIATAPNMFQDGTIVLRNPNAKRNGLAGVMGLEFNWVPARMEFAGQQYAKVAVRYRGNGTFVNSLFGPKQSFKVDLNKYVKGQGVAGIHTLNFVNSIPDNSYLHDALGQQLYRALGAVAPRTAYAYLSVDAPGAFTNQALGLYVMIENVDAQFATDRFGDKSVPIFKPVTPKLFEYWGEDWKKYAGVYDLKTKASPKQLARVIEFARLVTSADDAEFARALPDFLDYEEFSAFLAGHVLLANYDGFLANGQNYYLFLNPQDNRFGFIPWDQDHAWGEFGYVATADRREQASIWQPCSYDNHFLERVLKVESFRAVYRKKLEQALAGPFTVESLYPQIDRLAAVIRPAVAAESDFRLGRFDSAVANVWLTGPRDGVPEGPRAPVHQIKRFITNRVKSVHDQLAGTSEGFVLRRDR